ncbi:MAG: hypothetical protein IIA98_03120, partial [Proteobacteria bacterium]|nr:hypothetical protein [Pseudomonadota bacterium]
MTLGRRVQPHLPAVFDNCEQLDIPSLEWAGHAKQRGGDRYEFIGEHGALMALGCVSTQMLDVGVSGKKSGAGFSTQELANNRFRLKLNTKDSVKFNSAIDAALGTPETAPPARQDDMSSSLAKSSSLVGQ